MCDKVQFTAPSFEWLIKVNSPQDWTINDMVRKNDFPGDIETLEKIAKRIDPDAPFNPESVLDSSFIKEFVYLIVTVQKKGVRLVPTPSRNQVRFSLVSVKV